MAPEIFSKHYDEKIDVWAAGILLYELVLIINTRSVGKFHFTLKTHGIYKGKYKTMILNLIRRFGVM